MKPRSAYLLALGVGLLAVAATVALLQRGDPDTLTLVLDAPSAAQARECIENGYGVNVWTDSVSAVVTCVAPY